MPLPPAKRSIRLTPGALLLWYRQKFGHGLATAWYRDIVRPRILRTSPVTNTSDATCELHVLTSHRDWLNLLWTLKSFYKVSPNKYALCIHDDGSLPDAARRALKEHFPDARLILRPEADAKAAEELRDFPRCRSFRDTNLLAPKVFDFIAFLESDRLALFDSDLLFFDEPTAYLHCLDDAGSGKNVFNSDSESAYTVTPEIARQHAGLELAPKINSGLGLVYRNSIRWDWIEEFLALPGILEGHFWRIEQTLFALCSSRYGVELLPPEYTLFLTPGIGARPFRHYVGCIRHLMYREGIRELVRRGILNKPRRRNLTGIASEIES